MTLIHESINKFARFTRKHKLQRFDRIIRFLHNPDKQQQNPIKKVVMLNNNTLFSIDTSSYLEWTLFFYGEYEPFTQKIMKAMLKPGAIALDVGANIGIHTATMAQAVGPTGTVYSFEPHPKIFNKLIINISLNHLTWVQPIQAALTNTSGTVMLSGFNSSNEGTSKIIDAERDNNSIPQANQFYVPCITLDDFVSLKKITRLDLIKIDVEGHEEQVLNGAHTTLTTLTPILIFEDSKKSIITNKSPLKKLLDELSYTLYAIHYNHLQKLGEQKTNGYNFLAIPLVKPNKI